MSPVICQYLKRLFCGGVCPVVCTLVILTLAIPQEFPSPAIIWTFTICPLRGHKTFGTASTNVRTGGLVSTGTTVVEAEEEYPSTSVTVRVKTVVPVSVNRRGKEVEMTSPVPRELVMNGWLLMLQMAVYVVRL